MSSQTPRYSIELLAPARNAEIGICAINHGADAVYIGASSHGARAAAGNSVEDIARLCNYAHQFGARVYVTVNTLIYPSELKEVEKLIGRLYRVGVDALIVQDPGILRLDIPPIALHASTQCDIRTPEKARFFQDLGFSQIVLPREMTLEEIRAVRAATSVPLEGFVHGALCVSYSGQCYASLHCGGRSANRGECAQICRLPYDLIDGRGRVLAKGKHLLSLHDLNRLDDLPAMIDAGISSLKIEGRLKDEAYVKNTVSAYDRKLRKMGVERTSAGTVEREFTPDVSRSFNRGFTSHFLYDPRATGVAAHESPKSLGAEIGKVQSIRGNRIELQRPALLANGDGLNFLFRDKTVGFRVNRFEPPKTIICTGHNAPEGLKPGTILRRNADKRFADILAAPSTARRTIPLSLTLRRNGDSLIIDDASGAAAAIDFPKADEARTPQADARRRVIAKLGDTPYSLLQLTDMLGNEFVPASVLTRLRRELTEDLSDAMACSMKRELRAPEKADAIWPEGTSLPPEANIANPLAEQVMRSHGVTGTIERAPEAGGSPAAVMTMRYCLRRELGRCLLTEAGREWPEPLTLIGAPRPLTLRFDCARCLMQVL